MELILLVLGLFCGALIGVNILLWITGISLLIAVVLAAAITIDDRKLRNGIGLVDFLYSLKSILGAGVFFIVPIWIAWGCKTYLT
jgi:hypothetical protein